MRRGKRPTESVPNCIPRSVRVNQLDCGKSSIRVRSVRTEERYRRKRCHAGQWKRCGAFRGRVVWQAPSDEVDAVLAKREGGRAELSCRGQVGNPARSVLARSRRNEVIRTRPSANRPSRATGGPRPGVGFDGDGSGSLGSFRETQPPSLGLGNGPGRRRGWVRFVPDPAGVVGFVSSARPRGWLGSFRQAGGRGDRGRQPADRGWLGSFCPGGSGD